MSQKRPNIVQAEFFLVGGEEEDLAAVMRKARERVDEAVEEILRGNPPHIFDARIKAGVRFFDERGVVSRVVKKIRAYRKHYEVLQHRLTAKGKASLLLKVQLWWVVERIRQLEGMGRFNIVLQELKHALHSKRAVALEEFDHTYRPIADNEVYELLDSVSRARSVVWVFVFAHNELCSNTQTGLAYAM